MIDWYTYQMFLVHLLNACGIPRLIQWMRRHQRLMLQWQYVELVSSQLRSKFGCEIEKGGTMISGRNMLKHAWTATYYVRYVMCKTMYANNHSVIIHTIMQRVLDGWLFWQCFIEGKPLCTHQSPADKAIEDGQASGIGCNLRNHWCSVEVNRWYLWWFYCGWWSSFPFVSLYVVNRDEGGIV